MRERPTDNIVPLVEVAIAHRNRLIMRARRSVVADFTEINNAVTQIDHWLVSIAVRGNDDES